MSRPAAAGAADGARTGSDQPARAVTAPGRPFLPRRTRRGERAAVERPGTGAVPLASASGRWWPPVLACVLLAVLSLLGPSQPTYDPWAWIIWGREIVSGDLVTANGPSWKPLPVLFTTPFALLGDTAAPALWLVVARAGGLLAIVLAYRLASRLGGRVAGVIAGSALLLSDEFVRHFARGNSEGLLVALCLWAVERHLDGRRTSAFMLGFAAALLRPEVWPFFGLYGLWLAAVEPRRRLVVLAPFAATAVLWFVPEYLGSGDFLRAAARAREANPDSAAFADRPFLEVFRRAAGLLVLPVWVGGAVAVALAVWAGRRRRGSGVLLALAGVAALLMVGVGLMTEVGFAGNLRYVALPAALICVLAGVGWTSLVAAIARRLGREAGVAAGVTLAVVALPFAGTAVAGLGDSYERLSEEATVYDDLDRAIAASGGEAAAAACGRVVTGPYEVQVLAWKLHRHGNDIAIEGRSPGTVFALRGTPLAAGAPMDPLVATEHWIVERACGA